MQAQEYSGMWFDRVPKWRVSVRGCASWECGEQTIGRRHECSAEAGSQDGYRSTVPYPRSEQFSATQRAEGGDDGGGGRGEGICAVKGEAMGWDDEWEKVGDRWEVGCRWTMDVPLRRCTESNESNALEVR